MSNYIEMFDGIKPGKSNEALADAVVSRVQIRQRVKFRNTLVAVVIAVSLMGVTITAGAVNDWDYTAIARFFFGEDDIVVEGAHDVINYNIVENTIEGVNFEIAGLYADDLSILLAIEVTADEPIFGDDLSIVLWPGSGKTLFNHTLDKWVRCDWQQSSSSFTSEYTRTIIYRLTDINGSINEGDEFTILFPRFNWIGSFENTELRTLQGHVEIRFVVDKLALVNAVSVYPDVLLDNGNTITKVSINPFAVSIYFDGPKSPPTDNVTDHVSFIDINGKELRIHCASIDIFDGDGGRLMFINDEGALRTIQITEEDEDSNFFIIGVYYGAMYDSEGNEVVYISDGWQSGWQSGEADSATMLSIKISAFNVLDVKELAAVVYDGVVIPLG